jgi:hypothetical protein
MFKVMLTRMMVMIMVLGLEVDDGSGKNDHSSDADIGARAFCRL